MAFGEYYSTMDRGYASVAPPNTLADLPEMNSEFSPLSANPGDPSPDISEDMIPAPAPIDTSWSDPDRIGPFRPDFESQSSGDPAARVGMKEVGVSVTEGNRFGSFLQTVTSAIRLGGSAIELQPQLGGGAEATGVESYGIEARKALRDLARVNQVKLTTVHTPSQIGNLSGFNPQHGFSDDQRLASIEEVRKAIDFAADVTGGGPVVVHTGEYQRPISEQEWAKNPDGSYRFLGYAEEPGRAITYMVDDRTGRIISDVRKSQIIREPVYKEADHDYTDKNGKKVFKGDWIDKDGNYIDPANPDDLFSRIPRWDSDKTRFQTRKLSWTEIQERADKFNRRHPGENITPEEMAFRIQMETQMLQYRGSSLYHGRFYDQVKDRREKYLEALDWWTKFEGAIPKEKLDEVKVIADDASRYLGAQHIVAYDKKLPTQLLQDAIKQANQEMQYTHEASASADAQADTIQDTLDHVKPISQYAIEQSLKSYAEAGIHAMLQTKHNKNVTRDIFVAPENIFPETGYGSHPEELIELVEKSRERMVDYLTSPKVEDPTAQRDKDGNLKKVKNPYYMPGVSKEQAKREAEKHIKATFDTQHLGMWRKHFQPQYNKGEGRMETKQETDKRFRGWYMDQIGKMQKRGVLGHLHLVDSMGTGHTHLPIGQGMNPAIEAVEYLKKKGFSGTITSEGFAEEQHQPGRQFTEVLNAFGSPIYSSGFFGPAPGMARWTDIEDSYFRQMQTPYFIFGSYSPSNDWTLWSQVPLE
ncbi:hypothetical protein JXB02_04940 [Candidatus Woesearchaeota archaeon]|nr:hypothetical protein [Candidatus Woesearchaeota archaeon]